VLTKITMLKNYVLTTLRNIQKHLGYSLINIFGLGMGASASSIVLLITNEYTRLVVLAIVIAIPLSLHGIDSLLSGFAYKSWC